jgi:hypothetical protein
MSAFMSVMTQVPVPVVEPELEPVEIVIPPPVPEFPFPLLDPLLFPVLPAPSPVVLKMLCWLVAVHAAAAASPPARPATRRKR